MTPDKYECDWNNLTYFLKIENIAYGEINERRTLVTAAPGDVIQNGQRDLAKSRGTSRVEILSCFTSNKCTDFGKWS